ncbi:MAG: UvrB/UvrC motif-containing protein, partial [Alistipes sp.]|nr:UvrB/UvrC motif-containing protein [Alistipes sp.]
DMEGMLRNVRAITQIAGRAARHENGLVIMYAGKITKTMRTSIEESNRRRYKQIRYNMEHDMMPRQAHKSGSTQTLLTGKESQVQNLVADITSPYDTNANLDTRIAQARSDMERAAKSLDFLAAARFRDLMYELQKQKENGKR